MVFTAIRKQKVPKMRKMRKVAKLKGTHPSKITLKVKHRRATKAARLARRRNR